VRQTAGRPFSLKMTALRYYCYY